jgi:NTP pyrophosphatase (non-canonical NTP hydrolase)
MGLIRTFAQEVKPSYTRAKAIEELGELIVALTQEVTKTDNTSPEEHRLAIIDEIGDVQIQLNILKNIYGKTAVKQRIKEKKFKMRKLLGASRIPLDNEKSKV